MQTLHFPFFFFTITGLESQRDRISQMKPTWSRQATSSLMAQLLSSFILLGFCFTGLVSALIKSLWQMISGSISGILVGDYAKTSEFFDKNCLNNFFSWGCRFELIRSVHSRWFMSILNDLGSSSVLLLGFLTQWVSQDLGFRHTVIAIDQQSSFVSYPLESFH